MTAQLERDPGNDARPSGTSIAVRRLMPAAILLALATAVGLSLSPPRAAEVARSIPAPAVDETVASGAAAEVAVLAGGCFWGVQGVFQHVNGVTSAVSGYAGGAKNTAQYEVVSSGGTGHAESVRITFDPHHISYGRILQIYFSVAHNPTELNRQGPDSGTQYRSTIFPVSPDQAKIAKAYIAQLDQAHAFHAALATTVEPDRTFYPAEAYHQDYLTRNPTNPYIAYNDLPKIRQLQLTFPDLYRADPVLVGSSHVAAE
jgi:peptide-methionine (S)-S-oxide reductase